MFGPTRVRILALSERWQSGRLYLTRNQAMSYGIRGFESLPLRQWYQWIEPIHQNWLFSHLASIAPLLLLCWSI